MTPMTRANYRDALAPNRDLEVRQGSHLKP